jgi:hypothetical protein
MGEWWEFIIFPAFCIAMIWFIGSQLDLWDKIRSFLGSRQGGSVDFGEMAKSLKSVEFDGIGKFFRRD